jgi:hypothetical protein
MWGASAFKSEVPWDAPEPFWECREGPRLLAKPLAAVVKKALAAFGLAGKGVAAGERIW